MATDMTVTVGWTDCRETPDISSSSSCTGVESTTTLNNTENAWQGITGKTLRGEITIPLYSLIFLLAIGGNVLVIIVLAQNKKMRTVTNVFLVNLSVSDLLLALFCMPFTLIPTLMQDFVFGMVMCVLIRYMQGVSVGVCVFTLVAISLERHFAICQPLRSRTWQTMRHSYKTIGFIWFLSLIIMLPIAIFQRIYELPSGAHKCMEEWDDETLKKIYTIFLDLVLLVLPLGMMLCAYGFIAVTLFRGLNVSTSQKHSTELNSLPQGEETEDTDEDTIRYVVTSVHRTTSDTVSSAAAPRLINHPQRNYSGRQFQFFQGRLRRVGNGFQRRSDLSVSTVRARKRSIKMLVAVVLEFFFCWTPLYVVQTWSVFDYTGAVSSISAMSMNLIHLLAFVSSCCNPITYCFMSKRFRQSFLTVFYSCCPRGSRTYHRCGHGRSPTIQSGCSVHRVLSNYKTTEF